MRRKRLNEGARQRARIKAKLSQTVRVGQGNPVDPFHRHHFAGGAVPVHHRRANIRVILGIFHEFRGRGRFEPEVHLHAHRAGQRLDNLGQPQAAELGRQALGEPGGESHVRKVACKPPFRAGPQHFHRDGPLAFVSFHLSAMDLGD